MYDGIVNEIRYYSEKDENGRWIIPIEVDWDYTLTKCSSWDTGQMTLNEEAFKVMKRWCDDYNVGWILNTMRYDKILKEPLLILEKRGIKLYGLRKNPLQKEDDGVTKSFAIMSIDDRNLGTPLKWHDDCDRPYVDWNEINKIGTPILEKINNKLKNY